MFLTEKLVADDVAEATASVAASNCEVFFYFGINAVLRPELFLCHSAHSG